MATPWQLAPDPGRLTNLPPPAAGEAFRLSVKGLPPYKERRFSIRNPRHKDHDRFLALREAVERLLRNGGIVRNRLKVESTVRNAQAFLALQREFGSFDAYLWGFVGGAPRVNRWRTLRQVPARTPESDVLSRDLSSRGFKFVGSATNSCRRWVW